VVALALPTLEVQVGPAVSLQSATRKHGDEQGNQLLAVMELAVMAS
jgi:hypothetical protein